MLLQSYCEASKTLNAKEFQLNSQCSRRLRLTSRSSLEVRDDRKASGVCETYDSQLITGVHANMDSYSRQIRPFGKDQHQQPSSFLRILYLVVYKG